MTIPETIAPVPHVVGKPLTNDQLRGQISLVENSGGEWLGPVPDDEPKEG